VHQCSRNTNPGIVPKRYSSARNVPIATQCLLWGRAAGRCEFCNKALWKSSVTQEPVNLAQKAHIYSFSSRGPRGNGSISKADIHNIENLMFVCHECHQKLDKPGGEKRYTPELLKRMKAEHEHRIELVTGIAPDKRSHILLYGTNIGEHSSPLNDSETAAALFPECYPASTTAINLSTVNSAVSDRDEQFWATEADNLIRKFSHRVGERVATEEINHLSVFALAPQPLLVLLGVLLGDIVPADVYQRHREPTTWAWPSALATSTFEITPPVSTSGPPALVLSLSATVTPDRIFSVLGHDASLWTLTIPQPNNDFTKSREQLSQIRSLLRRVFDQIKAAHGQTSSLHIFPAVSVSVAVELGRVRMPKADMPWIIYDQTTGTSRFVPVLKIPYEV
jgi:SMODS-associated and fused to various effectors sensor domain